MDEKFLVGVCLGMVGGALIVANSVKARQMVESGTKMAKDKVTELMDKPNKKSKK